MDVGIATAVTSYQTKMFELGDRVRDVALAIFEEISLPVTKEGAADPKVLCLCLLGRTLSNYAGVIGMVRQRLLIEARTLARSCYENMFFAAKLESEGIAFVEKMRDQEVLNRRKASRLVLGDEDLAKRIAPDVKERLEAYEAALKTIARKPKTLTVKSVAEDSLVSHAYLAYSQLSIDAAHPTFTSLARHISGDVEDGEEVRTLDINPVVDDNSLDETLMLAFSGYIGVVVATNQMLGFTKSGASLSQLTEEYIALRLARWGS